MSEASGARKVRGELTGRIAHSLRSLLAEDARTRGRFSVHNDHGTNDQRGRIWCGMDRIARASNLTGVDLAIVDESQERVIVIGEVEETSCRPKNVISDVSAVLLSDVLRFRDQGVARTLRLPASAIVVGAAINPKGVKAEQFNKLAGRLEAWCSPLTLTIVAAPAVDLHDRYVAAVLDAVLERSGSPDPLRREPAGLAHG